MRRLSDFPSWLAPLLVLCSLGLAGGAAVSLLTDGREVGTDAPKLLRFVRHPLILFESYEETDLSSTWGSFPPLLPLLFGAGVAPWLAIASDFWAIRLGVLSWSALVLVLADRVLARVERAPPRDARAALLLFALVPSVWGAIGLIPEEEIYVGVFGLALYLAAATGRWHLVPWLLVLTALAAKYFLLILAVPLALASPRPLRNLCVFVGVPLAVLGSYVGYHFARFGLIPIASHVLVPEGAISIWGLLWNAGLRPPIELVRSASVLLCGGVVLAFAELARRAALPLVFSLAASLYLALLTLSITFPAYVLWVLPLMAICTARMSASSRGVAAALMFAWGVAEWSSNFFRGVGLALRGERAAGKEVLAARVSEWLGPAFPYDAVNLACVAAVIASGLALVALLWQSGRQARQEA